MIHFFCVGRVLEQPNVDWLKEIAAAGHPIGNHTYDHVAVLAHPSCLVVEDPQLETIRMICDMVDKAPQRGAIVGLDQIAARLGDAP
ncbi:MAG: polysaccharide deacetylase family protein [Planctomycetales bacterium]